MKSSADEALGKHPQMNTETRKELLRIYIYLVCTIFGVHTIKKRCRSFPATKVHELFEQGEAGRSDSLS